VPRGPKNARNGCHDQSKTPPPRGFSFNGHQGAVCDFVHNIARLTECPRDHRGRPAPLGLVPTPSGVRFGPVTPTEAALSIVLFPSGHLHQQCKESVG
jgi:hypothetical protein